MLNARQRKLVAVVAAVTLVSVNSAMAAQYNCSISNAGNQVKQCQIDSLNSSGNFCTYKFSNDLSGTCLALNFGGKTDLLACLIHNSNVSLADLARGAVLNSMPAGIRVTSPAPGFTAGGATWTDGPGGNVTGLYVEKTGASQLDGSCYRL